MATVEADGHSVYLYLYGGKETPYGVRSLWIANTAPAPEGIDRKRMEAGLAPMLPAKSCAHPQGLGLAALEPLRLVWLEETTGVALYGRDGLLGILPSAEEPRSRCPGFAAGCTERTPLAWPLAAADADHARGRLASAEAFWKRWEGDGEWESLQPALLAPVDAALGSAGRYFAVDQGEWPPRFVVSRTAGDAEVLVTGGACIRRQPGLAGALADAAGPPRFELAMAFRAPLPPGELEKVASYLGGNLQLPWMRRTWLGPGHTIPCDAIPPSLGGGSTFTAVLVEPEVPGAPALRLPDYGGDPVTLLWLLPITAAERDLARKGGSAAVLDALAAAGVAWPHTDRRPVLEG